jgi:hypothetical protein
VLGTSAIQATAISFCLLFAVPGVATSPNKELARVASATTIIVLPVCLFTSITNRKVLSWLVDGVVDKRNSRQKLIAVAWIAPVPSTEDRLAMNI